MNLTLQTRFQLLVLASLCACTPAPGQPEGGDNTSSDETTSNETTTNETTSNETGSDEAGPGEGCDACGAGQLCVATLDGDVCSLGSGYTIDCVDAPASCSDSACDPACVEALCGAGAECVPECGDPGVDVWCGWNNAAPQSCDPLAADCPAGEKCVPIATTPGGTYDDSICVAVSGDAEAGEICMAHAGGADTCGADSYCSAAPGQVGYCQLMCGVGATCTDGLGCLVANGGAIAICLPACELNAPDCGEEQTCVPAMAGKGVCVASPGSSQGLACDERAGGCNPGYACLESGVLNGCNATACCTSFCELDDPQACAGLAPNDWCAAFFAPGEAPAGFENVGVCILPG